MFVYFSAKLLKSYNNSRKSSPNRTPQKRQATERPKNLHMKEDEIMTVSERIDSRPTSLTISGTNDNETTV